MVFSFLFDLSLPVSPLAPTVPLAVSCSPPSSAVSQCPSPPLVSFAAIRYLWYVDKRVKWHLPFGLHSGCDVQSKLFLLPLLRRPAVWLGVWK